jgi:hypothetical protein
MEKKRSVRTELQNDNGIVSLSEISSTIQVEEFTLLFMAISSLQLSDQKDNIF